MEPVTRTVDTDSYMRVLSGLVAKGETVCLTITGRQHDARSLCTGGTAYALLNRAGRSGAGTWHFIAEGTANTLCTE